MSEEITVYVDLRNHLIVCDNIQIDLIDKMVYDTSSGESAPIPEPVLYALRELMLYLHELTNVGKLSRIIEILERRPSIKNKWSYSAVRRKLRICDISGAYYVLNKIISVNRSREMVLQYYKMFMTNRLKLEKINRWYAVVNSKRIPINKKVAIIILESIIECARYIGDRKDLCVLGILSSKLDKLSERNRKVLFKVLSEYTRVLTHLLVVEKQQDVVVST